MKQLIGVGFIAFAFALTSCESSQDYSSKKVDSLDNQLDSVSYLFGYGTGQQWKQQGLENIDMDVFLGAMNEAFEGKEALIPMEEGSMMVREYIMAQREKKSQENLEEGKKFLEENAGKEGVQTTESGLQYIVKEEGTGEKPGPEDEVKILYEGKLLNETVFDSSLDAENPAVLQVNRFIKGFSEGLQLMSEGAKYTFFIPSEIAYGERGSMNIEPNSTLIFDVELLEIVKAEDESSDADSTEQETQE